MNDHFRLALLEVSQFKSELMQRCRVAACNSLAANHIFVHVREQQPQGGRVRRRDEDRIVVPPQQEDVRPDVNAAAADIHRYLQNVPLLKCSFAVYEPICSEITAEQDPLVAYFWIVTVRCTIKFVVNRPAQNSSSYFPELLRLGSIEAKKYFSD